VCAGTPVHYEQTKRERRVRPRLSAARDADYGLPSVGRCRFKRVETSVESAWFQRLKLEYDELLSNLAFNLNLRRYTSGWQDVSQADLLALIAPYYARPDLTRDHKRKQLLVGRCSLPVSKPVLKAPTSMVSALEAIM